jgi:hypothetical protein
MDLQDVGCGGGVDWFYLAQNIDRWRSLVNTVMNLLLPYSAENFFLLSSQEGLCSMELVIHSFSFRINTESEILHLNHNVE